MTQEEKAKAYDEALERAKKWYYAPNADKMPTYANRIIKEIFPELKENEDDRIREGIIRNLEYLMNKSEGFVKDELKERIAWLEKQGQTFTKKDVDDAYLKCVCDAKSELEKQGKNHCMIQWKGDNLKEVIDFTGKDKNFEKWFKSFEEYEKYVQEHDGIFKLFNTDGSHYEVPVGAWIVKTPDGYNIASRYVFRQKPAAWSEEDEKMIWAIPLIIKNYPNQEMFYGYSKEKLISWIKSLKERYAWRPNDKQIEALESAT